MTYFFSLSGESNAWNAPVCNLDNRLPTVTLWLSIAATPFPLIKRASVLYIGIFNVYDLNNIPDEREIHTHTREYSAYKMRLRILIYFFNKMRYLCRRACLHSNDLSRFTIRGCEKETRSSYYMHIIIHTIEK